MGRPYSTVYSDIADAPTSRPDRIYTAPLGGAVYGIRSPLDYIERLVK